MNSTQSDRSPDEIERDIKRTQDDMSRTVDRLGDQFTPRNLVNALLDKAEENDVQARAIYDGARRNPLALGLLSAGAIWLVSDYDAHPKAFNSSNTNQDDDNGVPDLDTSYERDHRSYIEHMSTVERRDGEDDALYQRRRDDARANFLMIERAHDEDDQSYRKRLDDATNQMRQKRDEMAENARKTRDHAKAKARELRDQVSDRSQRGMRRTSDLYNSNPLVGGAIAALVGLIAGSAAPATRKERQMLANHAESTLDTAKAHGQNLAEKARSKKDAALEKAERKVDPDRSETSDSISKEPVSS